METEENKCNSCGGFNPIYKQFAKIRSIKKENLKMFQDVKPLNQITLNIYSRLGLTF